MSNLEYIRHLEDQFRYSVSKLIDVLKIEGKNILSNLTKKYSLDSKSIFYEYYKIIVQRNDKHYLNYVSKLNYDNSANTSRFNIEVAYLDYIRKYDEIKDFAYNINFSKFDKNNLRLLFIYINKKNEYLLRLISVELNSEYNNYYTILDEFKETLSEIQNKISIILHKAYQFNNYFKDVNYENLKLLSPEKLKFGDIIIFDEKNRYKSSLVTRQLKTFMGSTFMHTAFYFSKKEFNRPLIFEAKGTNRKKNSINEIHFQDEMIYLILRPRKKIPRTLISSIEDNIYLFINKKFSLMRIYGAAVNYNLTKLYKSWFPFLTAGKNIYMGKGVYCSESIAELYENIGYNISNSEDFGMFSPTDLMNSYQFDIIGYIKTENKKT